MLDIDSLSTFCGLSNGFVVTWYDQSGTGKNATQATLSSQPKIYDSTNGVITVNNFPSIEFDGSNDVLISPNITSGTTARSSFGITKIKVPSPTTGGNPLYSYNSTTAGTGGNWTINLEASSLAVRVGGNSTYSYIRPPGVDLDLITTMLDTNQDTASVQNWQNGNFLPKIQTTSNASINTANQNSLIGGYSQVVVFINGYISELIFYNIYQFVNRDSIENNIISYYNII